MNIKVKDLSVPVEGRLKRYYTYAFDDAGEEYINGYFFGVEFQQETHCRHCGLLMDVSYPEEASNVWLENIGDECEACYYGVYDY